jgi:hypothetical protein
MYLKKRNIYSITQRVNRVNLTHSNGKTFVPYRELSLFLSWYKAVRLSLNTIRVIGVPIPLFRGY